MVKQSNGKVNKGVHSDVPNVISGVHQIYERIDKGFKRWLVYFRRSFVIRLPHIRSVRRNVIVWLVIMLCLIVGAAAQLSLYYASVSAVKNVAGGSYTEGTLDKLTTINPLTVSTDTERAMSLLVYPSLLRYDETGHLMGYLAESWRVSADAKTWTINLKDSPIWSDGKKITARDVVFTTELMSQTSGTNSLAGVKVTSKGDQTVIFELPTASASFVSGLTFGVLPEHIFRGKSRADISSAISGASNLVSGGPYKLAQTNSANNSWHLTRNDNYWGGVPNLNEITFREYDSAADMASALKSGAIMSASGLTMNQVGLIRDNGEVIESQASDGTYAIFNTDSEEFADARVRRAVRLMIDRNKLRDKLAKRNKVSKIAPLETPIGKGIYKNVDDIKQPNLSVAEAARLLEAAGYTKTDGTWHSGSQANLSRPIKVVAASGSDNADVAKIIVDDLNDGGFKAKLELVDSETLRQSYIQARNYDIIVYSYHLGADPDVSTYWSSSQAKTGLNLANYTNRRADIALTAGRVNTDETVRAARYAAFVNDWINDCPAIALYQGKSYRVTHDGVKTVGSDDVIVDASSNIAHIMDWSARRGVVMQTP